MKITLVEIMLYTTWQQHHDFRIHIEYVFGFKVAKEFLFAMNKYGWDEAIGMFSDYQTNNSWPRLQKIVNEVKKAIERITMEEPERFE